MKEPNKLKERIREVIDVFMTDEKFDREIVTNDILQLLKEDRQKTRDEMANYFLKHGEIPPGNYTFDAKL